MAKLSSSHEMGMPSVEDFEVLKEAFIELGNSAWVKSQNSYNNQYCQNSLFIYAERLYADLDLLAWPPFSICLSGILLTFSEGESLAVSYREFAHNDKTENSSVDHKYMLRTKHGELVEFGQNIEAHPIIDSPRTDESVVFSDIKLDQVAEGEKILKLRTGDQLEITAGDCGILFDRMTDLLI